MGVENEEIKQMVKSENKKYAWMTVVLLVGFGALLVWLSGIFTILSEGYLLPGDTAMIMDENVFIMMVMCASILALGVSVIMRGKLQWLAGIISFVALIVFFVKLNSDRMELVACKDLKGVTIHMGGFGNFTVLAYMILAGLLISTIGGGLAWRKNALEKLK